MTLRRKGKLAIASLAVTGALYAGIAISQQPPPSAQDLQSKQVLHNPAMMKEILKDRDLRNEMINNKDMVQEALKTREIREEMLLYPDMQQFILQHEDLKALIPPEDLKKIEK
jgi:hypothetical protein